ncbi:MAG: DUF6519 domain-containing protein [Actinoplanes sp.]
MKGDFTRRTFRGANHYRGVLLQQGRVALDADWNEQVEIQQHLDEAAARDTIGVHGGPADTAGFAVLARGGVPQACAGAELTVSAGRYYVQGILCENDEDVPLGAQPDLPGVGLPERDGRYVAYLDVWREHLTALERPQLREVALGGPDTGTRSRTIWQVRLEEVPDKQVRPDDVAPPWSAASEARDGRLRARAEPSGTAAGPCVIPPAAGYRRLENQLYRVEIRGTDTFVWSRENGSVAARVLARTGDVLVIDTPGRDDALGFAAGDWVELTDLDRTRRAEPGFLARLGEVTGSRLTVAAWSGPAPANDEVPAATTVVRRWDSPGAVPISAGWLALEDGIEVEFEAEGGYRHGDHWLIPARTAALSEEDDELSGTVQWPRAADGSPAYAQPDGVVHRTAAIALLDRRDGKWTRLYDCRALFEPLADARPQPPSAPPTGLHVEHVRLGRGGTELRNDTGIGLVDLLGGIVVVLDGPPAPVPLTGRPVLTLTLEIPYPLAEADRTAYQLEPGQSLGTQPLVLAGTVEITGTELRWKPGEALANLSRLLLQVVNRGLGTRVFCRLRLDGRSVRHADHPDQVLNGLTLTTVRPDDQGVDLVLPSTDDVRGADFTMWCWIDLYRGAVFDSEETRFDRDRSFW